MGNPSSISLFPLLVLLINSFHQFNCDQFTTPTENPTLPSTTREISRSLHLGDNNLNNNNEEYLIPFPNDPNPPPLANPIPQRQPAQNSFIPSTPYQSYQHVHQPTAIHNVDRISDNAPGDWNWKGTNDNLEKNWSPEAHELQKTVNLQIVDDPFYLHGRPRWPHDEYFNFYVPPGYPPGIVGPGIGPGGIPLRNGSGSFGSTKQQSVQSPNEYHWQQLPYLHQVQNQQSEPGLYNVDTNPIIVNPNTGLFNGPNGLPYRILSQGTDNPNNPKSIGNPSDIDKKNIDRQFYHDPASYFDYYKRKRFRFEVHPGLIVAPLAAAAAYGLTSAITNKPFLFEWGLVNHKHVHPHLHHHHAYPGYPGLGVGGYPYPYPGLGGPFYKNDALSHSASSEHPIFQQDNQNQNQFHQSDPIEKVPTTDFPILKPQSHNQHQQQSAFFDPFSNNNNNKFHSPSQFNPNSNPSSMSNNNGGNPEGHGSQWWNPFKLLKFGS